MEQIDTPKKVKEFLVDQAIDFEDDASEAWLLTLAKRRLKRRLFAAGDDSLKRNCNVSIAISLNDLIKAMMRMKAKDDASQEKEKLWPMVRFLIEDIAEPSVIRLKHQVIDSDKCTGNIVHGVCKRCHCEVEGVLAYTFKVLAVDVNDPTRQLGIQFSHKGGLSLFKKSAAVQEFNALVSDAQDRATEAVEGVPVIAKFIVTYDPDDEDFFICAFNAYVQ